MWDVNFCSAGVSKNIFILSSYLINCLAEFRGMLKTLLHCFLFFNLTSSVVFEKTKAICFLFYCMWPVFSFLKHAGSSQDLLFVPRVLKFHNDTTWCGFFFLLYGIKKQNSLCYAFTGHSKLEMCIFSFWKIFLNYFVDFHSAIFSVFSFYNSCLFVCFGCYIS